MLDIIYSKKQINPLIEKYQIDVEKNVTFQSIIKMFQDATNYQIWAIKAVFENALTLPTLEQIRQWIEANPSDIKNLIKGIVFG